MFIRAIEIRSLGGVRDDEGWTLLHYAKYCDMENFVAQIDALLGHGLDINARSHQGDTVLHIVASQDTSEKLEHLIALGADVHQVNKEQQAPLFAASAQNAAALLRHGAHIDHQSSGAYSALD